MNDNMYEGNSQNINPQAVPNNQTPYTSQPAMGQTIMQNNNMNTTVSQGQFVQNPQVNSQPAQVQPNPMSAVANLNKEEAMEEALSHTTQYSPFEAPKQEVNQEVKKTSNKNAYIFIGIIFAIMLLFIIFLPQISKSFGW